MAAKALEHGQQAAPRLHLRLLLLGDGRQRDGDGVQAAQRPRAAGRLAGRGGPAGGTGARLGLRLGLSWGLRGQDLGRRLGGLGGLCGLGLGLRQGHGLRPLVLSLLRHSAALKTDLITDHEATSGRCGALSDKQTTLLLQKGTF